MNSIWEDFARYIFHVEVQIEPSSAAGQQWRASAARARSSTGSLTYTGGVGAGQRARSRAATRRSAGRVASPSPRTRS